VQRDRFLRYAWRVLHQVQGFHEFVPFQRMLSPKTVRIRALLNFVVLKRSRRNAAAGNHFALVNPRSDARCKPRVNLAKLQIRFGQRDAFHATHLCIHGQQQLELRLQRNLERIFSERALPAVEIALGKFPADS